MTEQEEKLKKMIDSVTEKAAETIMPRLKLVNGQLRGTMNQRTRDENLDKLSSFVTQVYKKGLEDGYNLGKLENQI